MALIEHYTRSPEGDFDVTRYRDDPMAFVVKHIPDGVPFEIYHEAIGEDHLVTEDFEALRLPGTFYIIEGAGGGALGGIMKVFSLILRPIAKLLMPSAPSAGSSNLANSQSDSPNNSLTDRNNKPRPYDRSYDICGKVQTIPNNLMTTYKAFNSSGRIVEYGYYDAGRGPLQINAADVTDGDTRVQDITGSSVAIYGPYTSPNNTLTPQLRIGDKIDQGLYVTVESNEVDGIVLQAQNGVQITADGLQVSLSGSIGTAYDPSGDAGFDSLFAVGDIAFFDEVRAIRDGDDLDLSGRYQVTAVSPSTLNVNVASNLGQWQQIPSTTGVIGTEGRHKIGPNDPYAASLTDWVSINRIPVERVVVNVAAANGMYYDSGSGGKKRRTVVVEAQYQLIDDAGVAFGPVYTKQGTITGRDPDYTGVTIYAPLPTASKVRVRMRRVTNLDLNFQGQVVDEVTYINLYGQTIDKTPHYGNRTTVHSARKQTPRAAEVRQPQLRMIATELVYKYLGNGVFDTVLAPNTQAVQSLIRLLRDPVVGNLTLTARNMDKLLAVQSEIETYFGTTDAGQFCYTFDSYKSTMQDIIAVIAEAIFCTAYRRGADILLDFERPRIGPEMVFTHRSKTTASEKWTRTFSDKDTYDSLTFSYIDPVTNVKETISIPEEGGANPETYDSKGIRNYKQAYWAAHRRFQRNALKKVSVGFTATDEGVFAIPNRAISVVKGARMAPQDGYIIAVDGLKLTLSQPVEFTAGDDHSVILKRRDGSVQSVSVVPGNTDREVVMLSAPSEAIYTGNSELKTEFSFGNESRHNAQMMLVTTVDPGDDRTVRITAVNYEAEYYAYDGVSPFGRAFTDGFSNGFQ